MHPGDIRQLSETYGSGCWNIICTADDRRRHEYTERVRRRLHSDFASRQGLGGAPCDPQRP
eukprot:9792931-Alexandrium_andersonii.AAC.1